MAGIFSEFNFDKRLPSMDVQLLSDAMLTAEVFSLGVVYFNSELFPKFSAEVNAPVLPALKG